MANSATARAIEPDLDADESGACMCPDFFGGRRGLHIWGSEGCRYERASLPSDPRVEG
jgi:hypothetical protein